MNKIIAILLLVAVAAQAKYIPEIQDAIVLHPQLIKLMRTDVNAQSRNVALPDTKIIGGNDATPGQFPYQCHLDIRVGALAYFCGCSVLSDTWILTAAHCVDNNRTTAVTVTLGDTNQLTNEGTEQEIAASSWKYNAEWNPNLITNDVAVIKLSKPAVLGSAVQPVCLAPATESDQLDFYAGKTARVSGWGKTTDTGSVSNALKYVDVPVLNYTTCNRAFLLAFSRTNICTDTVGNKGTCNGDSGGPLVLTENGVTKQIGIVSFGSGTSCTSEPSVFTRVSSFRSWVESNIEGATLNNC